MTENLEKNYQTLVRDYEILVKKMSVQIDEQAQLISKLTMRVEQMEKTSAQELIDKHEFAKRIGKSATTIYRNHYIDKLFETPEGYTQEACIEGAGKQKSALYRWPLVIEYMSINKKRKNIK